VLPENNDVLGAQDANIYRSHAERLARRRSFTKLMSLRASDREFTSSQVRAKRGYFHRLEPISTPHCRHWVSRMMNFLEDFVFSTCPVLTKTAPSGEEGCLSYDRADEYELIAHYVNAVVERAAPLAESSRHCNTRFENERIIRWSSPTWYSAVLPTSFSTEASPQIPEYCPPTKLKRILFSSRTY
jgi:hypothetical protein